MFPLIVPPEFVVIAGDYHSGQTTALYSVSSTGKVYNRKYLDSLIAELDECLFIGSLDDSEVIEDFINWAWSADVANPE